MSEGTVQNETSDPPHSPAATEEHGEIESDRSEHCVSVVPWICQVLQAQRKH